MVYRNLCRIERPAAPSWARPVTSEATSHILQSLFRSRKRLRENPSASLAETTQDSRQPLSSTTSKGSSLSLEHPYYSTGFACCQGVFGTFLKVFGRSNSPNYASSPKRCHRVPFPLEQLYNTTNSAKCQALFKNFFNFF